MPLNGNETIKRRPPIRTEKEKIITTFKKKKKLSSAAVAATRVGRSASGTRTGTVTATAAFGP